MTAPWEKPGSNFIVKAIEGDLQRADGAGRVATRFPPEPNGYLHIGHAKAICLNFGIAEKYRGVCHLRFDDTNPEKESRAYVESIIEDVRWLGFDWGGHLYYASDYFERLYEYALRLIEDGKAYVDSLSPEQIRDYRGTLVKPGRDSPYRDRPVRENLALFEAMRAGRHAEGAHVLRARIDMGASNLNMRDPAIYRIRKRPHYRTGNRWHIYPMYDYTQCLSDAIEGVTHSLCTLEFEDHRPLYDWFLRQLPVPCRPRQIEFSRLNLSYSVTSKRLLGQLVAAGHVAGWDDPRLPTLRGMRRRGYPAAAVRNFCSCIGLTKKDALIELAALETCVRDELNRTVPRALAVLRPLRVVIENYPEGQTEELEAPNHADDASLGSRRLPFCRELYIERDDFREDPPAGFRRLAPGREVRLRFAYLVTCREAIREPVSGEVVELRCRYDPASRGGNAPDGRKVKGTLHWVSARHAVRAEVRLYERLFDDPNPAALGDAWLRSLAPRSLETVRAWLEPGLAACRPGSRYQFERLGYFCADAADHAPPARPVFNRTLPLRARPQ